MGITKKELTKIVQEEYQLELNKRVLKRKINEVSNKINSLNEEVVSTENKGTTIDGYKLSNDGDNIIVYVSGYEPVKIDGDKFIDMYERKVSKKFPSIMTNSEILMSFKNTDQDISDHLKNYIENAKTLKPVG